MSQVFSKVNNKIFSNALVDGELALIQAILQLGDSSGSDVLGNPFGEVRRRLAVAGINPHAQAKLASFLAPFETKYAAGQRP